MAGRALGLIEAHAGDHHTASAWIADARRRNDRVSDRYVWVSAYIALADLELTLRYDSNEAAQAAARLHDHAVRADLPEFLAWAALYRAEAGDPTQISLARTIADGVDNPALQARVKALDWASSRS